MNIRQYLRSKYKVTIPTTMTKCEARAFGIPYPLRSGWLELFGDMEITDLMTQKMMRSLSSRSAKQKKKGIKKSRHTDRGLAVLRAYTDAPKQAAKQWISSDAFYASREWKELRYKAIQIHGGRCQCCGATAAHGVMIHVDHIKPRSKFPELELVLGNLQVLCDVCNIGKSNKDDSDWRPVKPNEFDIRAIEHLRLIK